MTLRSPVCGSHPWPALLIGVVVALLALAPAARAADRIYWANSGGGKISSASLDGSGGSDLDTGATTVSSPTGTAIDAAHGRVYWADNNGSAIKFANLDGSGGGGTLDTTGATVSQIRGMVLDLATGRIYWANENANKISYANLDGSSGGDLDTTGATVDSPAGVSIDLSAGRIYWANENSTTHPISSANLDGSGGGADLDTTGATASTPTGPTLDLAAGKVYWANLGNGTVSFANLSGGGGGQLATTGATVAGPFGTALDSGAARIYTASRDGTTISGVNLGGSGGSDLDTAGATVSSPMNPSLLEAPVGTGAPQVAGTAQVGHQLSCSQGDWAADKVSELLYRAPASFDYQWLRDGTPIGGATASTHDFTEADSGHTITCRVTAHNFAGQAQQTSDPARGPSERIFWANLGNSTISFADLAGGNGGELDTAGAAGHSPDGLAIDSTTGRIYWANASGAGIAYANLDGSGGGGNLNTTGANVNVPAGLVVDPGAGKAYWGNFNSSPDSAISYAHLDGSGGAPIETAPATVSSPSGLAIDTASNTLYWSNFGSDTHAISFTPVGGSGSDLTVLGQTAGVYALAIDQADNRIYWANNAANSIWYVDLAGGVAHPLNTTGATVSEPSGIAIDHAAGIVWWTNFGDPSHAVSYANIDGTGGDDLDTTGASPSGASYPNILRKPSSTSNPVVSGLAGAGHNLSCSHGGWAPDLLGAFLYRAPESYGYQWLKDGSPISGETGRTYSVTAGDVGHQMECRVTARNLGGDTDATSAPTTIKTKPANTVPPSISGTPVSGHTLTCHRGTWSGSTPQTYAYRWLRGSAPISGATKATYVVKAADVGKQLRCRVTASNPAGSATATSAAVLIKTPPKNTVAPRITGQPKVGKTLACNKGTWTGSTPITYTYQWRRNGSPIAGATHATYVAKTADRNRLISCKVTAHNVAGTATKTSGAVKVT